MQSKDIYNIYKKARVLIVSFTEHNLIQDLRYHQPQNKQINVLRQIFSSLNALKMDL